MITRELKIENGFLQFVVGDADTKQVFTVALFKRNDADNSCYGAVATGINYHSTVQQYKGQEPTPDCQYLNGRPCYMDGTSLVDWAMEMLLSKNGEEQIWQMLEERQRSF